MFVYITKDPAQGLACTRHTLSCMVDLISDSLIFVFGEIDQRNDDDNNYYNWFGEFS